MTTRSIIARNRRSFSNIIVWLFFAYQIDGKIVEKLQVLRD